MYVGMFVRMALGTAGILWNVDIGTIVVAFNSMYPYTYVHANVHHFTVEIWNDALKTDIDLENCQILKIIENYKNIKKFVFSLKCDNKNSL